MSILTSQEKAFLDVFLHEATTAPFTGPATESLHKIGVEYGDISYVAWAYDQDCPRRSYEWGQAAADVPPVPWPSRESALRRNREVERVWQQHCQPVSTPQSS